MKAATVLSALQKDPQEILDRLLTFAESRLDKPSGGTARFTDEAEIYARTGVKQFVSDPALAEIREHVRRKKMEIPLPPSGVQHDAGFPLATFCYLWCRTHQPKLIIETGVGNGVTTAFILQALASNGSGELWSIDLPPLGNESFTGFLVPSHLRSRWVLHAGRTRRLLPSLLRKAGQIDMFLHDSLHTAKNMTFEYQSAWPKLSVNGLLASDDVTFFNHCFEEFTASHDVNFSAIHPSGFGIAIKK